MILLTPPSFYRDDVTLLFDMDGTLTEARQLVRKPIVDDMSYLTTVAKVGIVSGSPLEYIKQQLKPLFDDERTVKENIFIFPCNGTQAYKWCGNSLGFHQFYHTNIKDYMKKRSSYNTNPYRKLIDTVMDLQFRFLQEFKNVDITGNFISYRGSMLNWCPIGRDSCNGVRDKFKIVDSDQNIRKKFHEILRVRLDASGFHDIDCALGGSTSIDIYPKGWDKTHCLQHIRPSQAWFWGDRCELGGNDYALYRELARSNKAFSVTSPEDLRRSLRAHAPVDWYPHDLRTGELERSSTIGSD